VPPNDGHRKNILKKWHTKFGVGIAVPVGIQQPCMSQEFVDEFDAWASKQGRLPKWTSWDAYVLARGISAALNLGTWALKLDKVASVARLRTYLVTEAYGDPIDVVVLGRDVQKVQADLSQVQQSAARRCSTELTDAYNEVVRISRAMRAAQKTTD